MISSVIKHFKLPGGVTIERKGKGDYDANGIYQWGAPTTLVVPIAGGHPSSGATLQQLPEGTRASDAFTFYLMQEMRTAVENGNAQDVIVYGTKRYELEMVEDWPGNGGFWVGHGILTKATPPVPA